MDLLRKLVLCVLVCHVTAWINQFDEPFTFLCPSETSLVHVVSSHNNYHQDRVWEFSCRVPPHNDSKMTNCEWTGYENEFDDPLTFQCARDGIIAGISSVHSNYHEDRRFKFYCCELPGYTAGACYFTPYVNNLNEHMDYAVPGGKVMRGVDSYHDNHREDRRFRFEICDLIAHDSTILG